MTTFVCLYRGATIGDAQLVALSAEPRLVAEVVERLLHGLESPTDPIQARITNGRRAALRLVRQEVGDAAN